MPLSRLAELCATLRAAPLPEAARHGARRCLLDWFAAAIPGGALPPATALAEALGESAGAALLYPSLAAVSARRAALVNAAAAHTLEVDDIYRDALYHPGAPVIAAALALAQERGASGEALLRAVVAGYEVSTRIGVAVAPSHYRHWHATGTLGTFGAAAAAATLLGLDARAAGDALANAATLAAGLQQALHGGGMGKPLHAGHAAETGLLVALAAARGVSGAPRMLDGPHGFAAAMAEAADWEGALAGLGERWSVSAVTFKAHACCGHCFAALDALLGLRERHGLAAEAIRAVRVATYAKAVEITGRADPASAVEARFSLPYCAAAALSLGRVGVAAFSAERLADPAIRRLAARVELAVDAEAEAAFPRRRSARVEIETRDGRRLTAHAPTRHGDPDDPLGDGELEDKLAELAGPLIGEPALERLRGRIWGLDRLAETRALRW